MRFIRATELYDLGSGERIEHPDASATDADVRAAVEGREDAPF